MTNKLPKPVFSKVESRFVFKLCSTSPVLTLRSVFVQGKQEHILGLNYNTGYNFSGRSEDGLAVQHNYYLGDNLDKLKHLLRMFAKGQPGPYGIGLFSGDDVVISRDEHGVRLSFKFNQFGVAEMQIVKTVTPRKSDNVVVAVDQLIELINVIENQKAIVEEHAEILGRIKDATGFFPQCNTRSTFDFNDATWSAE